MLLRCPLCANIHLCGATRASMCSLAAGVAAAQGNCTFKVLGWDSTALDETKPAGRQDYKKMGGQVFARAGVWPREK